MSYFQEFLLNLYQYLLLTPKCSSGLIRKHFRQLEKDGDLSYSILTVTQRSQNPSSSKTSDLKDLPKDSIKWSLKVARCGILDDTVSIFLERGTTFKKVIQQTLEQGIKYGSEKIIFPNKFVLITEVIKTDLALLSLSHLRVIFIKTVLERCLEFCDCIYENETSVDIKISLQSNSRGQSIFCAGVTKSNVSAEQYYKKRNVDMRLMAEHKYGLRVSNNIGWQTLFEKLGHAAVAIDLLQNQPSRTFAIISDNSVSNSSSKGAAFILYNCARLATLFKEFDKKVSSNVYPTLPSLMDVDLKLLTEPEEWELLYVYVLQFPTIVQKCINEIIDYKINIHGLCSFMSGLCSVFSIYYRRVRVLTEPRDHLFPFIHARIFLLKAVEQVLHNGLHLLDIEPVRQM